MTKILSYASSTPLVKISAQTREVRPSMQMPIHPPADQQMPTSTDINAAPPNIADIYIAFSLVLTSGSRLYRIVRLEISQTVEPMSSNTKPTAIPAR